jgi:CheY-like chemotaxis protein
MTAPLNILLVEDRLPQAVMLQEQLQYYRADTFHVSWVDRLEKAIATVRETRYDAVLLDLTLPDSTGFETVAKLQAVAPLLPIVVVTGVQEEDIAVRAIHEGAQDYLVKDGLTASAMARAIRYAIDRKHSEQRFRLLSQTAGQLLASANPQALVEDLCGQVMAFLECHVFFNFVVDQRPGRMVLNAYAGIPAAEAAKLRHLDFGVAVCGCVAQSRQRIVAENIANTDDRRTDLVRCFGVQAYCCHPLIAHGGLLGTLSFGTRTRTTFTEDEVAMMRTVADQVATAMYRIETERTLRGNNAELTRFNRALVDRELRMIELKREVNDLCAKAGMPPRYVVSE